MSDTIPTNAENTEPAPEPPSPGTSSGAAAATPVPKKRKNRSWRRILTIGLLTIVALAVLGRVVIAVAFPLVLRKVAAAYDMDASYSRMELYLLGGDVGLWDLTIRPKAGGAPLMMTEYARGDVSSLNLLRGKLVVHRAELDGMQIDVQRDADGRIPALQKLLASLGASPETDEPAKELSLDPPLQVEAVRINRLRAHWVDRSVSPPVDTRLEMTLRLSDLGIGGRPAQLLIDATSPTLFDTLRVEGTASAQGKRLDAQLDVLLRGLHPKPASGYLAPIGIKPVGEDITVAAATAISIHTIDSTGAGASTAPVTTETATAAPTTRPVDFAGTVVIANVSAKADGHEAAGVDRVAIEIDRLGGTAARLSKVTIDGVRANASLSAEGNIRFAGLELAATEPAPSTEPSTAPTPMTSPPATRPIGAPLTLALGELAINNVRAAFRDDTVTPPADLAFVAEQLTVTGIDSARPEAPVAIAGAFSSPGVAKSIRLTGTMLPFAATRTLDAKLVAQGIKPDAIRAYLAALGVESTFAEGAMTCDLGAAVTVAADGSIRADGNVSNIVLSDGDAGELLAFEAATLSGVSLDPNGSRVRVEAVELTGPRFAARRAADGSISAVGFRTKPRPPTMPASPSPAPATVAAAPATPTVSSPPPRFQLGRFAWKGVDVRFVDEAVAPATNVRVTDAGVELADLVIDLDPNKTTAASPGTVRAWIVAAGVADALRVDGTIAPAAGALTADLNVTGTGLRGDLLAPYLKSAGIEPALRDGSLKLRTRASITRQENDTVAVSVAVEGLQYTDGGQELVGLDRLSIDDASLTAEGIAVASVLLEKPRAMAQRNADGSVNVAGLRVNLPSTQPAAPPDDPAPVAASTPAPTTPPAPAPFVATLDKLRINGGSIAWVDRAVAPAVQAIGRANVEVDQFVFGRDAAPAAVKIVASVDETLESFAAAGALSPSTTSPALRLDVTGTGLREGVLAAYLPPGVNVAMTGGRFRAKLEAGVTPHAQGGRGASLVVSGVDYRDGESPQPLLSFDAARVLVSRADVPGKVVAIDEVSLAGLQAAARRARDGSVHALGLKFSSPAPATSEPQTLPPAGQKPAPAPAPAATQPDGSTDVNALIAAGREKLPLVTLKTLAITLSRVSFVDESQPHASPVALADVVLRNRAPIELLGVDPHNRPPVDLELIGRVDPLVGQFTVTTQVAPYASQPTLNLGIDATGINGAQLTSILPALREHIDGAGLTDGRFGAALEATAKVARSGPAELDFSRPMEVTATIRDVAFRADGSADAAVLAGVQEVRADGVRIDPASGSVVARSVEISRPIARAWREADGIHALGLLIKTPEAQDAADPSTRPATTSPEAPLVADAGSSDGSAGVTPEKPQAEMTIAKLTVSGIDVVVEDRSVDPPLIVPLNSLEAEVRGLSNMALHEARPIRFNVNAGAAKVPLGDEKPPREMFSEIAASGNVTLHPSPRGWARSNVSGLEMRSLRGPAAASDVNIEGGVFDSRVDVRFRDDGALDTRARFAFTDLRMSEPDDGVLRRVLKLPGPLDAMIIVLQDASGAITVPLNVTVEENSVSGGQVAGAAVTALGSILATAIASSPLKVTDGVTQLVGLDPLFGKKQPTGPQQAGAVEFYPGAGDAAETVTLQQLIERMRRDKTLEVTLRHELGGGDIARAAQRANPSSDDAAALGEYLRQRKAALMGQRDELAPVARAMLMADPRSGAREAIAQLREFEAQLAATEDALDRAYDLTRPGAARQAERRTRAGSLEIAEARLNATKDLIVAADIPDAKNRVRVIKPQFAATEGDAGGKVMMVVTSKKKP